MSETPEMLKPATEDWAQLVAGQPSPWLRRQLLLELGRDPDDAVMVGEFLDPDFADALEAAQAMLFAAPARVLTVESGPAEVVVPTAATREVPVTVGPPRFNAALAVCAFLLSYLWRELFYQWLLVGIFFGLRALVDYWEATPRIQIRRAQEGGDQELAEALIAHFFRRRTGT